MGHKTVIRGEGGVITHVFYTKNMYLPVKEHQKVMDTEITGEMVKKMISREVKHSYVVLQQIANGDLSPEELKLKVLLMSEEIRESDHNPLYI